MIGFHAKVLKYELNINVEEIVMMKCKPGTGILSRNVQLSTQSGCEPFNFLISIGFMKLNILVLSLL